jgi:hypothetical protein
MTRPREATFTTESIDLASFLAAAGYEPSISRNPDGTRAVFTFEVTEGLHQAVLAYEQGAALPAKRLLNRRSWLFREASRIARARG